MCLLNDFISHERLKGFQHESIEAKRRHVQRFIAFIGKEVLKATSEDVCRYLDSLCLSTEKINLHHTHIRQFYDFLIESGTCITNPAQGYLRQTKSTKQPPEVLTEQEVKDMLIAAVRRYIRRKHDLLMKRDRAILEMLYSSGLRMCEVISLNIDDIDIEHREISIVHAKGGTERIVPIGEAALEALEAYLEERSKLLTLGDTEALFLSKIGKRISRPSFMRIIYRRKREAGITTPGATHLFRRSCASHLLAHGAPIQAIGRLLGHECIDTTERYTKVSEPDLRDVFLDSHPRALVLRRTEPVEVSAVEAREVK
jgi:integrase/recombinase XerD